MPTQPAPKAPPHYAERPTAALQARREALLALPRSLNDEEYSELHALGAELERRGVLSIGIDF